MLVGNACKLGSNPGDSHNINHRSMRKREVRIAMVDRIWEGKKVKEKGNLMTIILMTKLLNLLVQVQGSLGIGLLLCLYFFHGIHRPTQKTNGKMKTKGNWTNEDLTKAIDFYDLGYKLSDCAKAFNIPKSSLKNQFNGKTTTRKIGPKTVLTKQKEGFVIEYIYEMLDVEQPLTPQMLKLTQFKDGIPGDSWFHWFKKRHLHLVMRVPQGLDFARAKAMNPSTMQIFYSNLLQQYNSYAYTPSHIWNVDENGYNASKVGLSKVLAIKGIRHVHAQIPNEREWLSVFISINAVDGTILHFFSSRGRGG